MQDTKERLGVMSEIIQELDKRVIELQSRIRRLEATALKEKKVPNDSLSSDIELLKDHLLVLAERLKDHEEKTKFDCF